VRACSRRGMAAPPASPAIREVLTIIASKWTVLIVDQLASGPKRPAKAEPGRGRRPCRRRAARTDGSRPIDRAILMANGMTIVSH
jgi:hypothetical protein